MSEGERILRLTCLFVTVAGLFGGVYAGSAGLADLFGVLFGTALERYVVALSRC